MNYKRNKALFFSSTASSNSDRCIAPSCSDMFKMQFFFGVLFAIILMSKHVSSNAEIQEKESAHLSNDYGNSHFFFFFQWKVPSTWDYMWKTNHKEYSNTVCALFFFFISNAFNLLTFKFNFFPINVLPKLIRFSHLA